MKNIPSPLNNILRERYLKEAVTTAPQIFYTKKQEEEPIYGTKTPVYTPQPIEPITPAASEFPDVSFIEKAKEQAKIGYEESPLKRRSPSEGYTGIRSRSEEIADRIVRQQLERDLETNYSKRRRSSQRRDVRVAVGLGGLPEIDYSKPYEKTKQLVRNMVPELKPTLKGVPYQAAHLGLGYFPFVAGKELGDTDLLPNDPVLDLDPISATTALAAAEVATPYLVDFPLGLAKGQGLGGALRGAAQVARAGLQRLPFMAAAYGTAYGMGHLMDWSRKQREPQFQKDMQEYKSRQAALETRRRKEGREETNGEATKRVWELNNILQSYISPAGPQF
jgi:hypothetical protein